ncbi:hypothetical protein diail_273 [Diaporthe ilicicola]|nr:hypothetical protein diail_273 [Diaporthe ilicicola]
MFYMDAGQDSFVACTVLENVLRYKYKQVDDRVQILEYLNSDEILIILRLSAERYWKGLEPLNADSKSAKNAMPRPQPRLSKANETMARTESYCNLTDPPSELTEEALARLQSEIPFNLKYRKKLPDDVMARYGQINPSN